MDEHHLESRLMVYVHSVLHFRLDCGYVRVVYILVFLAAETVAAVGGQMEGAVGVVEVEFGRL